MMAMMVVMPMMSMIPMMMVMMSMIKMMPMIMWIFEWVLAKKATCHIQQSRHLSGHYCPMQDCRHAGAYFKRWRRHKALVHQKSATAVPQSSFPPRGQLFSAEAHQNLDHWARIFLDQAFNFFHFVFIFCSQMSALLCKSKKYALLSKNFVLDFLDLFFFFNYASSSNSLWACSSSFAARRQEAGI